jgi:hypothetical protein
MTGSFGKIYETLFPPRVRPYITFRWITVFVLVLLVWNVLFKLLIPLTPDMVAQFQAQARFFMRPVVLIPYDIAVLIAFWWIYASRRNQKHYPARVILYGMLLAAVGSQLVWWLVPFRT